MLNITDKDNSIDFVLTSEKDIIQRVIDAGRSFLIRHDISQTHAMETCLSELLENALLHGNRNMREKLIYCSIELMPGNKIKIIVEDQGNGANAEEMRIRSEHLNTYLYDNKYATQCIFNERNNRATVFIDARPSTTFNIVTDEQRTTITPSGNVTASTCDELKNVLNTVLKEAPRNLRFNLQHVDEIDSMALSLLIVFAKQIALRDTKCALYITDASPDLHTLFALTRIAEMYTIDPEPAPA